MLWKFNNDLHNDDLGKSLMSEKVFFVWNWWGILLTCIISIWLFLHIYVTVKIGSGTPLRKWLTWIPLVCIPLTFLLSGWVAGLLSIPTGMIVGVGIAKIVIRQV